MPIPSFSASDYANQLGTLLPSGRAWPRDLTGMMMQVMSWLSPTFARLHARAINLVTDGFPSTTVELLPQWEPSLGLPDPCAGISPTIQQRRAQVLARFINTGAQSVPAIRAFAAALGYSITITEFTPFRADFSAAGQAVYPQSYAHTFQVNAAATSPIVYFRADVSAAGEPIQSFVGNTVLQCEIASIAPAHTAVLFAYS